MCLSAVMTSVRAMQNYLAPDPRRSWRGLSVQEKQRRLDALRRKQQRQIELEVRLLEALR
jgi:hypothetical protein